MQDVSPYSALAVGYDVVMRHVAYDVWAAYMHQLLEKHHGSPRSLLELGCGTGSFALEMQPLGSYDYLATDGSPYMIEVARRKAAQTGLPVRFEVAGFTSVRVAQPVDAVLLLYDGLNYLLEEEALRRLLQGAREALRPGGLFLCDQSTLANSLNNEGDFDDAGEQDGFAYVRRSTFDPQARLHTTTFELTLAGTPYHERHVQRAYELAELRPLIREAGFEELAVYEGFTTHPATETAERVQWVLRKG